MRYRVLLLISLYFFTCSAFAQRDSSRVDLSSPYQTMFTFLSNLQEDNYNPDKAASFVKAEGLSMDYRIEIAIELKQILDGGGHYIYMNEVPKATDYYDSTRNAYEYVIVKDYPELYLEKSGKQWIISQRVIDNVDRIHKEVFRFGTHKLLNILPKVATRKIFGLHAWQHFGILMLALVSFIVHKLLTSLFEKIIYRVLKRSGRQQMADKYILPVARPLSVFVILGLLVVFIPVLQLAPDITQYMIMGLDALLPLFATIVCYRLVNILALYLEKAAMQTESTLDDQIVPLVRKTLKTFVVVIGTLVALENLNVPILPLLTGLSIGGLAFALAAQDTIKNFFGSLMIFIDKPFQIGDWVTSGDIDGTVEEVGFRSTRVRTFRNSVVYVPNGKLADSTIDNHGLRQYRRFYTQIAVTYDTPPYMIEEFVNGLRKIVENHPDTRKDYYHIYFNDMASFSLNIMFYIFFSVPDWPNELRARHEVLLQVVRLAEQLGINFAFPTQTLHMENFPGKPSLSPQYLERNDAKMKLEEFFRQD